MRLGLAVALAGLATLSPAFAQAGRDACAMLPEAELADVLGTTPELIEENGAGTGVSLCHWGGAEGQGIRLHSITAASQNIVGGTPLDYFGQMTAYRKESLGAENVRDIEGPWQAGFAEEFAENNPEKVYSVTFINKDDTVTLETYGFDISVTEALARSVAEAM